MNCTEKDMIDM